MMSDSLDLIVGRRLTADEVSALPATIRERVYLNWDADNTATATLIPKYEEPGRLRCNMATRCERAGECAMGRRHNEPVPSGKCYDVKPYVPGGVHVWDETVEANAPREGSAVARTLDADVRPLDSERQA